MNKNPNLIKQFLLGSLSEEGRDRFEREYFSNAERFEQLEVAENELIDSYVRGELPQVEQRQFRLQYLNSPQRRSKVEFARSLNEVAHKPSGPSLESGESSRWHRWFVPKMTMRWPQFALASAGFTVVLASGVLMLIQNRGLRQELHNQERANAKLRESQEVLARQVAQLGSPSSESAIKGQPEERAMVEQPLLPGVSLTLIPSVLRGGKEAQPRLVLPIRAASVRMRLVLEENEQGSRSFDAELQLVGSEKAPLKITSHAIAKAAGRTTVIFNIPSDLFQQGDYIITLYALGAGSTRNEIGSYTFRATGKSSRIPGQH